MGRYDFWRQGRGGGFSRSYDQDWRYRGGRGQPPPWWGDRHDPRYAGFQIPGSFRPERDYHPRDEEWDQRRSDHSAYGRQLNDQELRDAVRRRLFEDTSLRADGIDVKVADGIVTLTGRVSDYLEARYAWDDAWETEGVEGVISRIEVDPDESGGERRPGRTEDAPAETE